MCSEAVRPYEATGGYSNFFLIAVFFDVGGRALWGDTSKKTPTEEHGSILEADNSTCLPEKVLAALRSWFLSGIPLASSEAFSVHAG